MEEPVDLQKDDTTEPANNGSQESETKSNDEQEHFCCSFCQERFLAIEALLSHIRIHTGGLDSEEDQDEVQVPQKLKRLSVRLPLLKTGKMASLDSTDEGGEDGHGETTPNIPSTSQEDEKCGSEFKRTNASPGYQCPTCNRRFSRIIHQLNHKCEPTDTENRLDAINSGLKLYKCVTCKEEFGTRQEKLDHKCLTSESQDQDEDESQNAVDNEGQDAAAEDQEESDTEKSDEDDYDDTPPERPKLVVKFPTRKGFGKARRRKSKGTHRCNICHKSFTRGWNLKVHVQKAHPPGSPVQPKISPAKASPRASPRPAKRSQELAVVSEADTAESDAAADFHFRPSYSEKNMVLRRFASSNAYECPLCGKTMERREAMLSHIRDHRSETPYHCAHCDFKCAHSARIIKHLSHIHKIYQPNNPSSI
ncbi:uncharacterized protein [Amphiura filiformis]|uniref:uncharacterized protein n=1 Tax=Amphiura filiformis TaxID=82378 RepID=UPI003B210357